MTFVPPWMQVRKRRRRSPEPPAPADGYLSRAAAARYLGVSVRFLEGDTSIPKHDLGSPGARRATWRYHKRDLDEWMAARRRTRYSGEPA